MGETPPLCMAGWNGASCAGKGNTWRNPSPLHGGVERGKLCGQGEHVEKPLPFAWPGSCAGEGNTWRNPSHCACFDDLMGLTAEFTLEAT